MTVDPLVDALDQYRHGLEAELALLDQLVAVATRQRGVTARRDYEQLAIEGDERERLTRALVNVEEGLKPVRTTLAATPDRATRLPGYTSVLALRQRATALVASILATDEESLQALADAELARRTAVASLEQGETTLAAYRRVLSPPLGQASLVDRRG